MPAGRKPKPTHLKLVEGNRGKRRIPDTVQVPAANLSEPDWREWFTVTRGRSADVNQRLRKTARDEWRRVVPILTGYKLLTHLDLELIRDYCICVARIDQCERQLSVEGPTVFGARGMVKNPVLTVAGQYRQQLKFYIGELGFSPSSRGRLKLTEADDDQGDDLLD
jgi:P27 family predicted phage terminase small subunit